MSNSIPDNVSLDEFLVTVNARDQLRFYVVPKLDVAERLAREIEKKTGVKSRNLSGGSFVESRQWVSAQPGQFVTQTRIAFDGMCALLSREKAKSFELAFHNIQDNQNWGDRVLFAVRYDRAA
jgi:hypothetical protein